MDEIGEGNTMYGRQTNIWPRFLSLTRWLSVDTNLNPFPPIKQRSPPMPLLLVYPRDSIMERIICKNIGGFGRVCLWILRHSFLISLGVVLTSRWHPSGSSKRSDAILMDSGNVQKISGNGEKGQYLQKKRKKNSDVPGLEQDFRIVSSHRIVATRMPPVTLSRYLPHSFLQKEENY
ncbi:hypothetical protein NPIL_392121 [Nephila pilipes]|uniref:Uncharacterized protein n=1 Tax=Nephila pilipes TaxID=299642 RepID=A0A8X6TED5_NEPPI|nr:hypothetical protein NPIL_392121 [Nephila pilipes]